MTAEEHSFARQCLFACVRAQIFTCVRAHTRSRAISDRLRFLDSRGPIKLLFMELDSIRSSTAHSHTEDAKPPPALAHDSDIAGRLERMEAMLQTLCSAAADKSSLQETVGDSTGGSVVSPPILTQDATSVARSRPRRRPTQSTGSFLERVLVMNSEGLGPGPAADDSANHAGQTGPVRALRRESSTKQLAVTSSKGTATEAAPLRPLRKPMLKSDSLPSDAFAKATGLPDAAMPTQREWQLAILAQASGHAAMRLRDRLNGSGRRPSAAGKLQEWSKRAPGQHPARMDMDSFVKKGSMDFGGGNVATSTEASSTYSVLPRMENLSQALAPPTTSHKERNFRFIKINMHVALASTLMLS